MADGKEIEIKLIWSPEVDLIDPWTFKPMRRLLETDATQGVTQLFTAYYYDTVDFTLMKQGIAFRVRQEGVAWVATLKRDEGSRGGFFLRQEWNEKVDGPSPRPDLFPDVGVAADDLKSFMTTRFERTTWLLHMSGGSVVELAIDRGEITSGNKTLPIREVELELKQGRLCELFHVAAILSRYCGLIVENRSKFERGLELAGVRTRPVLAKSTSVPSHILTEDHCAGYFQQLLSEALRKQTVLLAESKQARRLRALRIQLRRLRSMLSFWEEFLPEKEMAAQAKRLRGWFHLLGEVREVDVLLLTLENEPEEETTRRRLRVRRKNLQRRVVTNLWEGGLTGLLFTMWSRIVSRQKKGTHEFPLEDTYCRAQLLSWSKKIRKDLRRLSRISNNESKLHSLRIRVKRLRYVMEDMPASPFYDVSVIENLKTVQDILGRVQDAGEKKRLLRELGAGDENLMSRLDQDQKDAMDALPAAADVLEKALFFG